MTLHETEKKFNFFYPLNTHEKKFRYQGSDFRSPGLELGIVIRPGSAGLWMPDHVRHDNRGILMFEWFPWLRPYPSSATALLWKVKRHRVVATGFITPLSLRDTASEKPQSLTRVPYYCLLFRRLF
jgi:hypothetical protein